MKVKIGFIGLGTMGKWMALNMLKAGFPLTVYDVAPKAVKFLTGQGARAAKSPADLAAQVDWLFLSLPDTEIVEKVIFGAKGVAEGAKARPYPRGPQHHQLHADPRDRPQIEGEGG